MRKYFQRVVVTTACYGAFFLQKSVWYERFDPFYNSLLLFPAMTPAIYSSLKEYVVSLDKVDVIYQIVMDLTKMLVL